MIKKKFTSSPTLISLFAVFVLLIGNPLQSFAATKILYQKGNYIFTQKNANDLLEIGEYLAGARFSNKDKNAFQVWAIADYKNKPKLGTKFYKTTIKTMLQKLRKSKGNNTYRAELYLVYVDAFKKHPEYRIFPDNFLSIVDRYKPPIKEALIIRQIRFNSVMQQYQSNQHSFNRSMQQMQRSSDAINKSIQDQATRSAITIPGGEIIRETDGKIFAKDYRGQRYEVTK